MPEVLPNRFLGDFSGEKTLTHSTHSFTVTSVPFKTQGTKSPYGYTEAQGHLCHAENIQALRMIQPGRLQTFHSSMPY